MKDKKQKMVLVALACLALTVVFSIPAAATDITVTAAPTFIEFGSTPGAWTLNGITGSGYVGEGITYYSNPLGDTAAPSATVLDGECFFTWSNNSSVNITVTVNWGAFTGGDADMTNSGSGSNGATSFGAYAWVSGQTYADKVIVAGSGSDSVYNTTAAGEDKKWGAEIATRTDSFTGSSPSSSTLTITAVEYSP